MSNISSDSFSEIYSLSLFIFFPFSSKSFDEAILFPFTLLRFAINSISELEHVVSISKYFDLTNLNLSSSFSTMSLIAGPCTLPVDIKAPPRSLNFGDISYPIIRSRVLLASYDLNFPISIISGFSIAFNTAGSVISLNLILFGSILSSRASFR